VLRKKTVHALSILAPVALAGLAACGSPPPTKMVANGKDDGVPANSASEQRLASGTAPKTAPGPAEDPTQPLTTPMGGDPSAAGAGAAGSGGAAGGGAAGGGATGKGGPKKGDPKVPKEKEPKSTGSKVSKAECKQIFDKYIDLTLASDTRFEGIPPEMIAQLKEQALSQAQSQKGDPCSTQEVSRTQYTCAMSAPTTAAWQRCMK
jgi:hypothetical protein